MRPSPFRTMVLVATALALCALSGATSLAEKGGGLHTIVDGADPVLGVVRVLVGNSAETRRSGYVEIRAYFNGMPLRRAEPVSVNGGGQTWVVVHFGQGLGEIIESAIIEDPDPIPA